MSAQPHLFDAYQRIVAIAVDKGAHPSSDYWIAHHRRRWTHPTAKHDFSRVGRAGDKDGQLVRVAATETIACTAKPSPGERWYWVIATNRTDGLRDFLNRLATFYDMLGIRYSRHDERIELSDAPFGVLGIPCTNKGARGPRAIGGGMNELCSWNVEGVNPAEEVAASICAMALPYPEAYFLYYSSPGGTLDYHATQFALGDTEHQIVAHAESWVANPGGTTRDRCWALAKGDQRVFNREYAAIAGTAGGSIIDTDDVDRADRIPPLPAWIGSESLFLDQASGGADTFAFMTARYVHPAAAQRVWVVDHPSGAETAQWRELPSHPVFFHVTSIGGFEQAAQMNATQIAEKLFAICAKRKIYTVFGDQRDSFLWSAVFARAGLKFQANPWTAQSKQAAADRLRDWFKGGIIIIPKNDRLRRELLQLSERVSRSGHVTYTGPGGHVGDYAATLVTAALADVEGQLSGSPINVGVQRNFDALPPG